MKRGNINLDAAQIAKSCANDWESMAGDERSRFCVECQKRVYNFSAMTRVEVEALLKETGGRVCARIIRDADGRVVTATRSMGLNLIPLRASKIASAVVTAALSLSSPVVANSRSTNGSQTIRIASPETKDRTAAEVNPPVMPATLKGTVFDMNEAVIVGAKIRAINEITKIEYTSFTGDRGTFQFDSLPQGTYQIEISSPGFQVTRLEKVKLNSTSILSLAVALEVATTMGEMVITDEKIDPSVIPLRLLQLIEPMKERIKKKN